MTTLVDRLNLVGCTHPCEQTLKWVLAVALMAHYDELPTPKIIAQKLDELKDVVVVERKPSNHTHITEFPVSPHDLHPDVYEHAYPNSPPVTVDFEGIMSFAETSIPLRKNSKLLHRAGTLDAASDDGHVKWSDLKKVIKKDGQQVDEQSAMSRPLKRSKSIPTDDDELELYHEYKAKLAKLKHDKAGGHMPIKVEPADTGQHGAFGLPLNVKKQADGSLMLSPRGRVSGKSEQGHAADAEVKSEPETKTTPGAEPTDEAGDTLEQFAKAAVDAFRKRKAQKQAVLKKPAAKKGIVEVEKKDKKPAAKMAVVEVGKKNIQAAMPRLPSDGSNPAPVKYNGGVIYTSIKSSSFRTLTTRGDKYSEKSCAKWKAKKPSIAEWPAAYTHIDRARAGSN